MSSVYVQTQGTLTTNSGNWTPIQGLSLTVPAGVQTTALVIVNLPNPYAEGNNFPGGNIGISVNGTVLPNYACFTYGVQQPQSYNRMPTTLVASVPLASKPQTVQAMWSGVRGSTVIIDSPASMCVILD